MFRLCAIALSSVFLLSACASGTFKARQEQREKMASNAGLYCEFINGDQHLDVDVELNMQMARRCDANRNFSITNYKNASDQIGVMYCCAMHGAREQKASRREAKPAPATPAPVQVAPAPVAVKPALATPAAEPKVDESSDEIVQEQLAK